MDHDLSITGNNFGQIVNGDNNVVTMTIHGDYIVNPDGPTHPRPVPTPVYIRPKSFPDLLDRKEEREETLGAIARNMTVELSGEPGLGKTAMLRYVSHTCTGDFCADGVIYVDGHDKPLGDILQFIYDTFYESDVRYRPTESELLRGLQKKRALIVIDNMLANDDAFRAFANKVPEATFLVASDHRCLVQEVDSVDLHGLPLDDAMLLIERELRHALTPQERIAARALWEICKGKPATLVAIAGDTRSKSSTLADAVAALSPADPAQSAADRILSDSSADERSILTVLAFFGGAAVAGEHLAAIAGLAGIGPMLGSLVDRHLAESSHEGYMLSADLVEPLRARLPYTAAGDRAVGYFAGYIARRRAEMSAEPMPANASRRGARAWNPLLLLPDSAAILRVVSWGGERGDWKDIIAIVPGIEAALTLSARWDERALVLKEGMNAARRAGDDAAIAWGLHQQGSLALCLGDDASARTLLARALELRRGLGDEAGAEVTSHNLARLGGGVVRRTGGRNRALLRVLGGLLVVGLLVYLLWPASPLVAPFNLHGGWESNQGAVLLAWTGRSDHETGFQMERRNVGGQFRMIASLPAGSAGYIDRTASADSAYIYRVRAIDGSRTSEYSNLDTVAVLVLPRAIHVDPIPPDPMPPIKDSVIVPDTTKPGSALNSPAVVLLSGLLLDSTQVSGESRVGATVELSAAAQEDMTIAIAASPGGVILVPPVVVIPKGARARRFFLSIGNVKSSLKIRVVASHRGIEKDAYLTVLAAPSRLVDLTLTPREFIYGDGSKVWGTVRIDRPAPDGGVHIDLSSSFPRLAGVPADGVTIPAGSTAQRFDIAIPTSISTPNPIKFSVMRVQVQTAVITAGDRRWNVSKSDTLTFRPRPKPPTNTDSTPKPPRFRAPVIKPITPIVKTVPK